MSLIPSPLIEALRDRYQIERELGQGGMATVYLAFDLKHHRKVAIKVLRAELSAIIGADRFLAEIRTTANLQHPHILPLFDSGDANGFLFFVMPYVEGDTLRDRLARERQLPIDEAVRIAAEVADALDHAHRHGVIHRDVKPANILLQEGRALVADFGIALAVSQASGGRVTETGLSLGTPQYMSPEQAAGERNLDGRTDVFALGCVLYEMLAGEPPHDGPNAQAVLARVMTVEARPVTQIRKTVPPYLEVTVAKALQKLPADRFPTAEAMARVLRNPAVAPTLEHRALPWLPRRLERFSLLLNLVLGLLVLVLAVLAFARNRAEEDPVSSPWVTRVPLEIDAGGIRANPVLSPDGQHVAWSDSAGIRVRSLDQVETQLVEGTAGAMNLVFAPNGGRLAFIVDGQLRTIAITGGSARRLADSVVSLTPVWTEDGWIYYTRRAPMVWRPGKRIPGTALLRMREQGGVEEQVLAADSMKIFVPVASLLQGKQILGMTWEVQPSSSFGVPTPRDTDWKVAVLDPGKDSISEFFSGRSPAFEPHTRHLLFLRGNTLMAAAFDPERSQAGEPFDIADNIGAFGLADDGSFWSVLGTTTRRIPVQIDRAGRTRELNLVSGEQETFGTGFFSPDGRRIIYDMQLEGSQSRDLWVYQLPNGPRTRLTYDCTCSFPAWSEDGQWVFFNQPSGVYRMRADASAPAERVLADSHIGWLQPIPGGGIVFERGITGKSLDVGTASLAGDTTIRFLVQGDANEEDPAVSPDGRWLAYESDETGRHEIYVMPFGTPGRGRQVSVNGGNNPYWSRSSKELFYTNGRTAFEAAEYRAESGFEVVRRNELFSTQGLVGRFQPGPGDSVFIGARQGGPRAAARFILVRNWVKELKARVEELRE